MNTTTKQLKTFSQSVEELTCQLRGQEWTFSQLLGKSQTYLQNTGTKNPSKPMRLKLAEAVYIRLLEVET